MSAEAAKSTPPPPAPPSTPVVTLASEELAWAQARAEREGRTVSAVVTEAVRRQRQSEAWAEVETWLREANPEPTADELEAVMREWGADTRHRRAHCA